MADTARLALVVNGRRYGGWKSVRVTRSIESLAGSFDIEASDRWGGQNEAWPIVEEDACRVELDGVVVLDGFVDHRKLALSGTSRSLSYEGRDRAAALVDNSAIGKWSFSGGSLVEMARQLAAPFGIAVSVQPGLVLKPQGKLTVHPGDKPYDAMHRAATDAGVLLISDGAGGVLITRASTSRLSTPLAQGVNVLTASIDYDATGRFRTYVIKTQTDGTDWVSGDSLRIHAEATDQGVRRADRVLLIHPEHGLSTTLARQRADWEARVRAARAEKVSISVQGWKVNGQIWPLNTLVPVHVPAIGIDGDLLISEAVHSLGADGELTQLSLVRPDAFLPEPHAVVKGEGLWKEIAHGVSVK